MDTLFIVTEGLKHLFYSDFLPLYTNHYTEDIRLLNTFPEVTKQILLIICLLSRSIIVSINFT